MINQEMPVLLLTMDDLISSACFDVKESINIVENAFHKYSKGEVIFPDKISVVFNQKEQNRINCLPAAILPENVYGMKWVSVFPNNPTIYNKPNLSAVYLLSELETGYPIAFMEGTLCSNLRTAAVGALGAKFFARKDSKTIGLIGAGEQAKAHFLAMMEIFDIKTCKVSSRTRSSEVEFVSKMKKFYPQVEYITCAGNYQEASQDADIIVTAISGQEKLLQANWIKKGAFYCHVGGLEDDFEVPLKADKIVCDNWNVVKHRTQTISQMYKLGQLTDDDIYADMHEIVNGSKCGRETDEEFVYFNSVGLSFVDVALAYWMYQKAIAAGKGMIINLKNKSMFDL